MALCDYMYINMCTRIQVVSHFGLRYALSNSTKIVALSEAEKIYLWRY